MSVRDALLSDPRVLPSAAAAAEAAELLLRPNVESVLVVDDGRLVGCVTGDSLVAAVARGDDLRALTAGDVADGDVTTIGPDAELEEALRLMADRGLERVAVVEDGRLLGIVARGPLLRRIAEDEPREDEPAPS